MKFHFIIIGIMLGLGASIPIGPINLEIIRRNLSFGMLSGLIFGIGASLADLTYLLLFCFSTITIFSHSIVLEIFGIAGAIVLAWFGFKTLRMEAKPLEGIKHHYPHFWQELLQGYLLTLLNPITILFWISISAQVAAISQKDTGVVGYIGFGLMLGILSWVIGLNYFLHKTHHRLPKSSIKWLNKIGGIILLGFAVIGLARAIFFS